MRFESVRRLVPNRHYLALFLVVLSCYAYFLPRWADWNQNSRFDLIVALVDNHTFAIDSYVANTGDYAAYDGHYYSDKAPGMALLGVPIYAALRHFMPPALMTRLDTTASTTAALAATLNPTGTGVQSQKLWFFVALVVVDFIVGVVPAAVLALIVFWMVGQLGGGHSEQWVASILYALATCAFAYANSLVGHQTSAFLLFVGFAVLFGVRRTRPGRQWLFVAGFLLAYAMITEYPTALIVMVVGLYALVTLPRGVSVLVHMCLGGLLPVAAMAIHDIGAFGTPLPVGYFHSALWTNVHDVGLVSLTYPHLDALWGITFGGYRGLFFLSPYLLFAAPGCRVLWRRGWHAETAVLLAVPVVYMLYNSASAMWQGGFAVGPRYIVASLPFLGLAAGVGVVAAWRRVVLRPVVGIAVAWSFCAVWVETLGGQAFPDTTPNPLFDFSLPKLLAGDVARNLGMVGGLGGWMSLLPLLVATLVWAAVALIPHLINIRVNFGDDGDLSGAVARSAT
jgi:hypothetical protein